MCVLDVLIDEFKSTALWSTEFPSPKKHLDSPYLWLQILEKKNKRWMLM
jgi:hypothetical protein